MGYSDNHLSAFLLPPQPLGEAREGSWAGLGLCCLDEVHARAVAPEVPTPSREPTLHNSDGSRGWCGDEI